MILKFYEFITESLETEVLTKKQIKKRIYFVKKEAEIVSPDDLDRFDIPESIQAMMRKWEVIQKSPYSNSFYSSTEIFWSSKPEGSYRVSDHWNFKSNYDNKKHCETNGPAPNNTHISIAKYTNGKYDIILSELSKKSLVRNIKNSLRRDYLKSPETIYKRSLFKRRIENGEIYIELELKDEVYKGRVLKYTGYELKIVNDNNDIIYNNNRLIKNMAINKMIKLSDINGFIENPFDIDL